MPQRFISWESTTNDSTSTTTVTDVDKRMCMEKAFRQFWLDLFSADLRDQDVIFESGHVTVANQ
jgi:hypothetical protein